VNSNSSIIKERNVDGVVILSLERGLKGMGEATLKERLDELVRAGHLQILVDLGGLPYVDSTELGRLIRCHLSVRQAGGRVRLCNLSEKVRMLMKMTRLDTVLELYGSEEEALEGIRGGSLRAGKS
jgi:anti-sigma B factor antagonist